jgi:IrrE N-terminal-like domain
VPPYIWDGESLPVPVEDIADSHLGLLVREAADLRMAPRAPDIPPVTPFRGLLLLERGEIWVNVGEAREWRGRRRFTTSHEIGHWQVHRTAATLAFCRTVAVDVSDDRAGPFPVSEDEANQFAAAVLMPARLVRREYARPDRDFAALRDTFGASGAAVGRLLHAVIR